MGSRVSLHSRDPAMGYNIFKDKLNIRNLNGKTSNFKELQFSRDKL